MDGYQQNLFNSKNTYQTLNQETLFLAPLKEYKVR